MRLRRIVGIAVAIVGVAFVGEAIAASNSIHPSVGFVKAGKPYTITVSGYAVGTDRVWLFADYQSCGSLATERARDSRAGVYFIHEVHHSFSLKSKGWTSGLKAKDHACAYLQKGSKPVGSSTGIVAHGFKTYTVH